MIDATLTKEILNNPTVWDEHCPDNCRSLIVYYSGGDILYGSDFINEYSIISKPLGLSSRIFSRPEPFNKYQLAYMDMAERFAETSEAERLKVGCLLVKNDRIQSLGVNGTPPGWHTNVCEDETGQTHDFVDHAEENALSKMWTSNDSTEGSDAYITHSPCLKCSVKLVTAKIARVFYRYPYRCDKGLDYLKEHGVEVWQL